MNKQLFIILIASVLAACASKPIKEPTAPAPAPVEQSQPAPEQTSTPSAPPAQTEAVMPSQTEVNPLTDPTNILSKRSVYFDFNRFEIKPEFRDLIEAHAKYLVAHPQTNIKLEGNADERGSHEYNLALGQKRAVAVKSALNVLGVPDSQIETISYGMEKPRALGHDEDSWAQNRRTDFVYPGE
jgi:peptidoglycan-associated lipoprotein